MWNRKKDDATLPELSPTGTSLSAAPKASTWHCIEYHLDGAGGRLESYLDGKLIEGLVIDGERTHDIDSQWLSKGPWTASVRNLRIGWEAYGNQKMTLWIDDVAVAKTRPGC